MRAQTLGGDRPVNFHLPADVEDASDWPMVILLHGFSASGWIEDIYLNLSQRVTELGIVLLLPDGTPNPEGLLFWNATDGCCDWYGLGVDDVTYLTTLIDEALLKLPVDPKRVFLLGHSNGGFMSYRMACDVADRIAGIASIAGASWKDAAKCAPSEPVSVLQIHGTEDWTIPYGGDLVNPSAEASVLQFVGHDGCSSEGMPVGNVWDFDAVVSGPETSATVWTDCEAGSEVQLWTMEGTGHIPGFQKEFLPAVVEFFLAHPKP
jgi:polyhydroxybutyrate depolymerase